MEKYKIFNDDSLKKLTELEIGKVGEHLVCADLILQGYKAYLSDQGLPYDVIVDIGNKLLRIQVKTTMNYKSVPQRVKPSKAYLFNSRRCGKGGKREYNNKEIDIVAFVCIKDNLIGYLKIEEVKTTMHFRTKKQNYCSSKKGRYLEDYTFSKIIGGK